MSNWKGNHGEDFLCDYGCPLGARLDSLTVQLLSCLRLDACIDHSVYVRTRTRLLWAQHGTIARVSANCRERVVCLRGKIYCNRDSFFSIALTACHRSVPFTLLRVALPLKVLHSLFLHTWPKRHRVSIVRLR